PCPSTGSYPAAPRPPSTARRAIAPEEPDSRAAAAPRIQPITRLLVLGHHFERLVRNGAVKDYAEIARITGLSRARVTQITNLTLLAPEIQVAILDLEATSPGYDRLHERRLREIGAEPQWSRQHSNTSR